MSRFKKLIQGLLVLFLISCSAQEKEIFSISTELHDVMSNVRNEYIPVSVKDISGAIAITAGQYHSCAILSDTSKNIQCWGGGSYGQLGDGNNRTHNTPVTVFGISNAKSFGIKFVQLL